MIRAAIDNDQFVESASGKIRIVIPPGTFDAIDVLLRWCYDGQCQLNEYVIRSEITVIERYVTGVTALWLLADFVHCRELCDEIISMLKSGGLRSGWAFANLVEEASDEMPQSSLIDAAIQGLPLKAEQRTQLEDIWLDNGSAEMLASLSRVYQSRYQHQHQHTDGRVENVDDNGEDVTSDDILNTLGEFLAEMRRTDRAKMTPIVFAQCLTRFPPGTIAEADYARIVLDYVEDRIESGISDDCIMALMGTIDFSTISQGGLQHSLIPRINQIFPSYAQLMNDFASMASTIITRCSFSSESLSDALWVHISCGGILSKKVVLALFPMSFESIDCPLCKKDMERRHKLTRSDLFANGQYTSRALLSGTNPAETERIQSYFQRKCAKTEALNSWISSYTESEVEVVAPRPEKRVRRSLLPTGFHTSPFVCVLNQCSSLGGESVFFYTIGSLDSSVEEIMDLFIKEVRIQGLAGSRGGGDVVIFFRSEPDGSLGERVSRDMTWSQLENAEGQINIIARRAQVGG